MTGWGRSPSLRRMTGLTYRNAGVDIEAGDRLVDRIKGIASATHTPHVLGSVGGFAGLCALPAMNDPILVSGTDGVGTKLKVAFEANKHDTVGIDLVAMCVNDILTVGATPLFFLDYLATGALDVDQAEAVIKGIAEGCKQSGCALLGGETAEMPGFYAKDEYDLAGFAVGVVERTEILDGTKVGADDVVVGVASTGLHSNGYSLARKALIEVGGLALDSHVPELGQTLADALLTPTQIYADAAKIALEHDVHAMCHITGGGLVGNLPRVLPESLGIELDEASWARPPIFDLVQKYGEVSRAEMHKTFNLGVGMAMVLSSDNAANFIKALSNAGQTCSQIGRVISRDGAPNTETDTKTGTETGSVTFTGS